ncbi:methyltransferase domain-containing protein [Paenibacillus arenilitoris]|uniref:Methyltransferase domain-containing protein n=1 Tax=Paenibacillus arenilitoris TaxID=2772299 RepID=A0A927CPQ7_9BACL|nr:methyltransferase domain-containing protein [Paenibacillus arenilitoris]MBD2869440.1 methyltransferase domain-containing protein [Paenibacillus arenilitoris]
MLSALRERAAAAELMDDFASGGPELREALRELRLLNRLFAAAAPTLHGVRRLWKAAGKPERLSILDVGAGSGDVNRRLLRWADDNRLDMTITLVDVTEEACEEARGLFRGESRVNVRRGSLFGLSEGCADIVTGTQFAHHFGREELPAVAASMLKASRLGVVLNDIHRHWIAWSAVWLATRVLSSNRYIRHDGPLSVAKGFRREDWRELEGALDSGGMYCAWRPLFRYAVVIGKRDSNSAGGVD